MRSEHRAIAAVVFHHLAAIAQSEADHHEDPAFRHEMDAEEAVEAIGSLPVGAGIRAGIVELVDRKPAGPGNSCTADSGQVETAASGVDGAGDRDLLTALMRTIIQLGLTGRRQSRAFH